MANTENTSDERGDVAADAGALPAPTSAAVIAQELPEEVADAVVDDIIDAELDEDPDDVPEDLGELWQEFHDVINMTSGELEAWLRTEAAGPTTETVPEHSGDQISRSVLAILGKRRVDVTPGDVDVMRHVVHTVRVERGTDAEATTEDSQWRRRLMALGHDPLKPAT
jgi:hypothetical protein